MCLICLEANVVYRETACLDRVYQPVYHGKGIKRMGGALGLGTRHQTDRDVVPMVSMRLGSKATSSTLIIR